MRARHPRHRLAGASLETATALAVAAGCPQPALAGVVLALVAACGGGGGSGSARDAGDAADAEVASDVRFDVPEPADGADASGAIPDRVRVLVTLDGAPVAGAVVMQGGAGAHVETGDDGTAWVELDRSISGAIEVVASHPRARIEGAPISGGTGEVVLALETFGPDDPAYPWQDPGEPRRSPVTAQCTHCHVTLGEDWYASAHRGSARNRVVQDTYRGTALSARDPEECAALGGAWSAEVPPGGGLPAPLCRVGDGAVSALAPCEGPGCADWAYGGCAACHAPGLSGATRGRDLRDAEGFAYQYGVHCDVCHRVERVDLTSASPGVAGRLGIVRPSEPASGSLGARLPLTFGPSHDSPNPRMGSVQRDHFRDGTLCAGCHQLDQPVLVPGVEIDRARWPSGLLPIHSTVAELEAGPLAGAVVCNDCHMPPAAGVLNAGDVQLNPIAVVGSIGGWYRAPGDVRHHSFPGPRTAGAALLRLAAALFVEATRAGDSLTVAVTTRNVGPAHALPTGEPMRAVILGVDVRCGDDAQPQIDGDVVSDVGGYADLRPRSADVTRWPGARVGDELRVVARPGGFVAYEGFGPFGDGTFDAPARGIPVERPAGTVTVTAVGADGTVATSAPLPGGELVYRAGSAREWAGAPGVAFARVLEGAGGARMVPHDRAVDVASDNRLLAQHAWTSTHVFHVACDDPTVIATLIHRAYPLEAERRHGWPDRDQVIATGRP